MRDCEHGQLARSCDRCDDAQRIRELEAEVERLSSRLDRVVLATWEHFMGIGGEMSTERFVESFLPAMAFDRRLSVFDEAIDDDDRLAWLRSLKERALA